MFKIYYKSIFEGSSSSVLPIISILISLFSLFAAVYFIYLTKRMEIINSKFQKLCISNIDDFFQSFDEKIKNNSTPLDFKKESTNFSSDLQMFIISLKNIYPEINISEICIIIEEYSDYIYSLKNFDNNDIKSKYLSMKLLVFEKLYNYALRNEMSLFNKIGFKKFVAKITSN